MMTHLSSALGCAKIDIFSGWEVEKCSFSISVRMASSVDGLVTSFFHMALEIPSSLATPNLLMVNVCSLESVLDILVVSLDSVQCCS